jgi:hypothetical protein
MFVTDKLVFVELHKTGGTHISAILGDLIGGHQEGKHNRLIAEYKNRFILGSIRNPWDWYVSLWAYGCGQQGSVYAQSSRRYNASYIRRQLPREMGKTWLSPYQLGRQLIAESTKPVGQWRWCYEDHEDPERFRSWLHLMLNGDRCYDIGEGYGFSPVSRNFGLLTYRYFKLFTDLGGALYKDSRLTSLAGLEDVWRQYAHVNCVIRNEKLEEDIVTALTQAEVNLTEDQKQQIFARRNQKINASKRREPSYYYDQATIDLVAQKEQLIVERYSYDAPSLV